jgi:hypothetical protein
MQFSEVARYGILHLQIASPQIVDTKCGLHRSQQAEARCHVDLDQAGVQLAIEPCCGIPQESKLEAIVALTIVEQQRISNISMVVMDLVQ